MYYKFKKQDLAKLFKIEDIDVNVNKLIVKKYVDEGNVLKSQNDNEKTAQEKKIAYLIINHDEICVNINEDKTVNNKEHLLAALMTDAREIVIKITDSKIQEEFIKQYQLQGISFRESNNLSIDENFLLGLTKDGWDNKEFILKKLADYKESYNNEKNRELSIELIAYIPKEQWEDEDFIEKFLAHPESFTIFKNAMEMDRNKTFDVLMNEKILQKSVELKKENLVHHYATIYNELNSKNSYGNYSLSKGRSNANADLIKKEKDFIKEIEKYFTDLKLARKMISLVDSEHFDLFDSQLRKNPDFYEQYITLALVHLNKKNTGYNAYIGNFTALVGVDSFTDKRIQEFALKHGNIIYDKTYQPLLATEIFKNDNEEIARLISIGKSTDFLWEYLSTEQKQDKSIAEAIVSKNPKIYNKLSEELRLNKDVFKAYYTTLKNNESLKDFKVGKINKNFFVSFTEEEIIDLISAVPNFLLEEKFPEKFFDSIKVMSHSNHDYNVFTTLNNNNEKFQQTIQKVFEDKELCMSMLPRNYNIYNYFSENIKSDMEVLDIFVQNTCHYDNLPNKVYYNKNLLLNIIQRNTEFVKKVPAEYFQDQDFLLRIFEKIDKKELNTKILTSMPTVINEILNTTKLEIGQYYPFFMKTFAHMNLEKRLEPGKNLKVKQNKI